MVKENTEFRIFGLAVTAFLVFTDCIFMYILIQTAFLTPLLTILCVAVLIGLTVAVLALTWDFRRRVRTVIGILLAIIILITQVIGGYYIAIGANALEKITEPQTEYSEIGIFVRINDPAEELSDTKGYTFGILGVQDRTATDIAIDEISEQLGEDINLKEYSGLEEIMNGLLTSEEVGAIILNKSFLDLLEDTEGHEDDSENVRELYSVKIEDDTLFEKNEASSEIFTVYISGIDTYGSLSRRSRSDVNILSTVNAETGQILLVSTPRDYYIPLSISNGVPDKLTHAGIYGIKVSRETIGMLYDTEIDYYFRVNFDGFKNIIDSLGGITVVSDYSFKTGKNSFVKGENYLNGTQALSFARERYKVPGGDRQRGRNQMAVIRAVIDKATGPALLTNYKDTLDSIAGSFETDMPYERITKMIQKQLSDGTKWNVESYSVDGTGASRKPYSMSSNAYVMIPDKATVEHAKELIQQVKDGKIPQP